MTSVTAWSIAEVVSWLSGLGLPAEVQESFKTNAVNGVDLIALTDEDLVRELGCTPLQARKIRQQLMQLGRTPPAVPAVARAALAGATVAVTPPPAAAAAAAASPFGGAFGQEPDPRTSFQATDLRRHQQLKAQAAELQDMQPSGRVSQAIQHLDGVKRALDAAQAAVPPTQAALAVEQEHIAKYGGEKFHLGKVFTTKHHQEVKLAESQEKAGKLTQQLREQEQAVATRQAELKEAQRQLAVWQAKVAELAATQRQQVELVERMFGAPAWRDSPRQTELAGALRALEGQAADAGRGLSTYGQGHKLLAESSQLLQQALQGLQQTQMFSMMEMGMGMGMHNGFGRPVPGHLFEDMMEMQIIRRSNDEISLAARKTLEARGMLPGLPQVDDRVLSSARMGIFQNMLFGGVGSDMIEMAMIRQSKRDVEQMLGQVQAACTWAQSNLAVYQQQDAALKAQAASKRGELESFRRAALQAALQAAAAPGVAA